jgi:hypothetical protein
MDKATERPMKFTWQLDPLKPESGVDICCDGVAVLHTSTLKNAITTCLILNAHQPLVDALRAVETALFAHAEPGKKNTGRNQYESVDDQQHPWIPGSEAWAVAKVVRDALARAQGKES